MDTTNNKVSINNVEYDVRDLSDLAKDLITLANVADKNIRKMESELILLQKGRQVIVADLITEVETQTGGQADE